jgi:hypothetical protein
MRRDGQPEPRAGDPQHDLRGLPEQSRAAGADLYGDRVNQVDLRIGKIVRFGERRASLNFDVYNVLNSSAVLIESTAYRTFRAPQFVMTPRFVKISAQLDF